MAEAAAAAVLYQVRVSTAELPQVLVEEEQKGMHLKGERLEVEALLLASDLTLKLECISTRYYDLCATGISALIAAGIHFFFLIYSTFLNLGFYLANSVSGCFPPWATEKKRGSRGTKCRESMEKCHQVSVGI